MTETTNSEGLITFAELPYDTYTIVETKTLNGYVPNAKPITIELKDQANGVLKEITIENTKKDLSVRLTKYNLNKSLKLPGAVFELRREMEMEGIYEVVTRYTTGQLSTDANGVINLKDLEPGKYQLVEVRAPGGYIIDRTPVEFEITENQTETVEVEKVNRRRSDPDPDPTPGPGPNVPTEEPEEPEDPEDTQDPDPTPEDEIFEEIDEDDMPFGNVDVDENDDPDEDLVIVDQDRIPKGTTDQLPKTGQANVILFYLVGLLLIMAGIFVIRKRRI